MLMGEKCLNLKNMPQVLANLPANQLLPQWQSGGHEFEINLKLLLYFSTVGSIKWL